MNLIIVLGSRINGTSIHPELKGRLDVAISLLDSDSKIMLSGGITNRELGKSEAELMKEYCLLHGVQDSEIMLEENSLDTIGNGFFTRVEVERLPKLAIIYVVSSCYHMSRSEFIFRKCYGPDYNLDFKNCFEFQRSDTMECESMDAARLFFSGISDGDIESVRARIYSLHNLYKGK